MALTVTGCVETKQLRMGRVFSESVMTGFTYDVSTYSDVVLELGKPDSIIIKDDYLLASWRGASVESVGISLAGNSSLLGTSSTGATRNLTIVFEKSSLLYTKYIIDTDPIRSDEWVSSGDKYL
jgi:hypothetical protein